MKTLYLYIGFPKTAATFLKSEIFLKLKDVCYISLREKELRYYFKKLAGEEFFEEDSKKLRNIISEKAVRERNLISFESLSGDPFGISKKTQSAILKDIKDTFNNFKIKIILGIREQSDLITSLYKQYLHEGGLKRLPNFLRMYDDSYSHRRNRAPFFNLCYSDYLKEIMELFGKDNVYVYIFEHFKKDKILFLRNLLDFLGEERVPEFRDKFYNKGYGTVQVALARVFNPFFKSHLNPSGPIPVFKIPLLGRISPRRFLQNKHSQKLFPWKFEISLESSKKIKRKCKRDNKIINREYNLSLPENYF